MCNIQNIVLCLHKRHSTKSDIFDKNEYVSVCWSEHNSVAWFGERARIPTASDVSLTQLRCVGTVKELSKPVKQLSINQLQMFRKVKQPAITGGSCHKYQFCRDKTRLLSRQK